MNMISAIHVLSEGFYFILVMQVTLLGSTGKRPKGILLMSVRVSWPRRTAAVGHNIQYAAGCSVEDKRRLTKRPRQLTRRVLLCLRNMNWIVQRLLPEQDR